MVYNGCMTTHNVYTVSDSEATKITPDGTHSGMDITIQNVSNSGNIYIGGQGVSASDYGYQIVPGAAISFELAGSDDLYIITDNDGTQAATIRMGLESQD